MSACTFFGHRDCPETVKPKLREVLVDLITNHDVDMFYVGHQGQFDAYVHSELKNMKKVKITAVRKASYPDLMEKYENPIQHACNVEEGQVWIANGWAKPEGFCDSAWDSISAFVMTLAHGGGDFYDGWMKNPKSAMISCNDGFRPVSFYLEALDEEADA